MKKIIVLFMTVLLVLIFSTTAPAKYRTFEVVEVTENSITLKDKKGKLLVLEKDPKDFKAGDMVRYNSRNNRLRKKKAKK